MIADPTLGFLLGVSLVFAIGCGDSGVRSSPRTNTAAAGLSTVKPSAEIETKAPPARPLSIGGIDLSTMGYDKGSPSAPVVVVEFSDFGCPYCAEFSRETFPGLDREFIRTGKVYFKYVPFVIGMFPNASEAARAAECAGEQDRFWPMYDRLFAAQSEWKRDRSPDAVFARYAASASLEKSHFAACYARAKTHPRTSRANEVAAKLGVRVTPSFIVNGRPVEGALPLADFRQLLTNQPRR